MFPLRDDIPSQRFPVVTLMLIALNPGESYEPSQ
jgi:hypothetical protein